ncbi:MAG: glutathione-disulfide reductase [Pseudomonadota bacterium]
MANFDYDFFVIGGGSGGVRAARRAGAMGVKVGLAEEYRMGGTCVIRGCVPKKLFVYASQYSDHFEDAAGYGWQVGETHFDWPTLIANKDREIDRLEGLYRKGLDGSNVEILDSRAVLRGKHEVYLEALDRTVTADKILVAVGGYPNPHDALPGHELCITSNDAFHLEQLPKSIIVAGGGYIAVEFANIFHGMGVDTTLLYRGQKILGGFDEDLRDHLQQTMIDKGIKIILHQVFEHIEKAEDGSLDARLSGGDVLNTDQVMLALGRKPNTEGLGLEAAGVETDVKGSIPVDDYSKTNVENIYAVGDVTDRMQLTPVAIHESMCLVQTLFKNNPTKPDHETIATAVFSQPEIGTVGLTEQQAVERYRDVEVYKTTFRPMHNVLPGRAEKMMMKLLVDADSRVVVGAHVIGPGAGEMAQLLGISIKAKCTKDHFDATMAVHPTASEELVTMYDPTYRVRGGQVLAA